MSTQEQRERFETHFGVPIEQRRAPSAGGYAQREIQMMWAGWLAAEATAIERCAKALCHQLLVRGTMDIGEACLMLRVVGSCPSDEDFESAIRALMGGEKS